MGTVFSVEGQPFCLNHAAHAVIRMTCEPRDEIAKTLLGMRYGEQRSFELSEGTQIVCAHHEAGTAMCEQCLHDVQQGAYLHPELAIAELLPEGTFAPRAA